MLQHLALVPHGIRGYAEKFKLSLMDAYDLSSVRFLELVNWVFKDHKIDNFTFCGLSYGAITTRTKEEVIPIFEVESNTYENLLADKTINEEEIRVNFVGNFSKLPKYYLRAMKKLQDQTKDFDKKFLYIFIGYDITPKKKMKNFEEWKVKKIDLLINTGKNVPLEIDEFTDKYFINKFFPEVNKEDINEAINHYYSTL
jgi:undecaprenyl diphosphate synthase